MLLGLYWSAWLQVLVPLLPTLVPAPEKEVLGKVVEVLSPMWVNTFEFQAPTVSLTHPGLLWVFGE